MAKPTYYWDKESKSYKSIPKGAPRTHVHNGDEFKNEAQIAAESAQFTYEELVTNEWNKVVNADKSPQHDPALNARDTYRLGFKKGWEISGELAGQTGFVSGAHTAIRQLSAPINVGSFEHVDELANAPLEQPRTTLAAIRRDNLTAEVAKVISAYAILPRDLKIAAVLDAIETTTGARFVREPGHEGTTYLPKKS